MRKDQVSGKHIKNSTYENFDKHSFGYFDFMVFGRYYLANRLFQILSKKRMEKSDNTGSTVIDVNYIYNAFKMYKKHKALKDQEMIERNYIQREPQVGDTVQKNYMKNPKFSKRTGVVIRKICGQSIVLWDFTKTPIYEFDKDLKVLKLEDKPKPKNQYMVFVFGIVTPPIFFDTYKEAELEAQRLLKKEQRTTYILKSVATMELGEIKINKSK